jgi:thiol-disulfide isomerase/thioredoxin
MTSWSGHGRRSLLAAMLAAGALPASRIALAARGARPSDFHLRAAVGAPWHGSFRLAEHLGRRPVLISFFATWCRPCESELPALERLRARLGGRGLIVVGVAIDGPDSAAQIGPMARRLGLRFPIVHDADSRVVARMNPRKLVPYLVMVDRAGKIVREREGFTPQDERALPAEVEALLPT